MLRLEENEYKPDKNNECLYYMIGNKFEMNEKESKVKQQIKNWIKILTEECKVNIKFLELTGIETINIRDIFTQISIDVFENQAPIKSKSYD